MKQIITQEAIVDTQEYLPMVSYRFWDLKDKKMFEVKEITYTHTSRPLFITVYEEKIRKDKTILKSFDEGHLLPSTGISCKNNEELFINDLVICNFLPGPNRIRMVYWDNGYRVFGISTDEFENNANDLVFRIGSRFEMPKIYEDYLKIITDKIQK